MVEPTAVQLALTKGKIMQALTRVHMIHNQLCPRQFFRAAYHRHFKTDMSDLALTNDVKQFEEYGTVPNYVVSMLIAIYGSC